MEELANGHGHSAWGSTGQCWQPAGCRSPGEMLAAGRSGQAKAAISVWGRGGCRAHSEPGTGRTHPGSPVQRSWL